MQGFTTTTARPMAEAEAAIRAALAEEGFGVLTEVDVAATLKAKIDVDRPPLKILGACNPGFAHRALAIDPTVALLLPCNVVLEATDDGTRITAIDPRTMMDEPVFAELAADAAAHLGAAVDAVAD